MKIAMLRIAYLIIALLGLGLVQRGSGQELTVVTKESPPFSMKTDSGEWEGYSIDLWEAVARQGGLEFRYVEADLGAALDGIASGQYQVGVAAISVTSDREREMDFTHPYHTTGLGIAAQADQGGLNWLAVVKAFFTWKFLSALAALTVVLLAAGFAIWLFERRSNEAQFGGTTVKGIGDGFWWSAVTMTTVGYGDKAPVTPGGRVVALVWMFTSVIVISSFTASIATSLTVNSMETPIERPSDIAGRRIAVLENATAESYVDEQGGRSAEYQSVSGALKALNASEEKFVMHDRDLLKYQAGDYEDIEILPLTFDRQEYAFALNVSPEMKEQINRSLLTVLESEAYREIRQRYELNEPGE